MTAARVPITAELRADVSVLLGKLAANDISGAVTHAQALGRHRSKAPRDLTLSEARDLIASVRRTLEAAPTVDAVAIAVQVFVDDEVTEKAPPPRSPRHARFLLADVEALSPKVKR